MSSMMHRTPLRADNRTVANGHVDRICRFAEAVAQHMDHKEVLSLDDVVNKETVDANDDNDDGDNAGGSNSGQDGNGSSSSGSGGGVTPARYMRWWTVRGSCADAKSPLPGSRMKGRPQCSSSCRRPTARRALRSDARCTRSSSKWAGRRVRASSHDECILKTMEELIVIRLGP